MKSYSLQKHQGQWMMRWSDYKKVDGVRKRSQPHYMVASVKNFPKKKDVVPLADAQFARVKRSRTVAAGATLSEFVKTAFVLNAETLASGTRKLYKQHWKRLEPHLGQMRLRNVMTPHIQAALDAIHDERKETLSHDTYLAIKVTASAIFTVAIRRGDHPGPNPENNTTVRSYGHHEKRPNGAYNLSEIRQFLTLFPTGDVAVAIGINAFLALRKPEVEALTPEDFDAASGLVRVHAHTKTKNDEKLPVIAPLRRILAMGWNQVNMRKAERAIVGALESTSLEWRGWYAFRRGMLTNLWRLKVPVEEACLILRNSSEVCRKHYLVLDAAVSRQGAMDTLEKAYEESAPVLQ